MWLTTSVYVTKCDQKTSVYVTICDQKTSVYVTKCNQKTSVMLKNVTKTSVYVSKCVAYTVPDAMVAHFLRKRRKRPVLYLLFLYIHVEVCK